VIVVFWVLAPAPAVHVGLLPALVVVPCVINLSDLSELTVLIDLRLVLRVGPFLGRPFLAYLLTCASRCDTITQTPKGDYCA
jgi:hypothetical protein